MNAQTGFRGRVGAAAFILEVPLIGEREARRRVIELWRDGAELRALPDERWLLRLAEQVDVRAETAPGLPLRVVSGALVAPGADVPQAGEIAWQWAGETRVEQVEALPVLRPADWLDSTRLQIAELKPIEIPEQPVPPVDHSDKVQAPDLRAVAKIGQPSRRAERAAAQLRGSRTGGFAGTRRGQDTATAGGAGGPHEPGWQRFHSALARLTLRSPAAPLVRRHHERYLRELMRAFEERRWDEALREAVGLGGTGAESDLLTLRLPGRRGALRPSPTVGSGAAALPYGPTVYQHLEELYRTAVKELEGCGKVEEAAFVLADLLNSPGEAVDLLEHHKRWRMAAELAEGRELAPDLVVRLWWRAGRRDRAVDVARSRGAFAGGILRLERVDAAAAHELRRAWVHDRQAAGDHIGAVEAAWPEETLRPLVVSSLESGIALGGADAAQLFAYLVVYRPSDATRRTAQALLDGDDADGMIARARFGTTFVELECADRSTDRALATAGLRALVRDAGWVLDRNTLNRVTKTLSSRADPLAVADLSKPVRRQVHKPGESLSITASGPPGTARVFDAAALRAGAVLVACGDGGAVLLTRDGRVRARWDIPTHQLVLADHGGAALLVTHRESAKDVHRLDLASRKVRHWTTLHVRTILSSYDGGLLTAISEDGIVVLDVFADRPRVVWREMTDANEILSVSRTSTSITALGSMLLDGWPRSHLFQAWRWDLPAWTLRNRSSVELTDATTAHVLADGTVLSLHPDRENAGVLLRRGDGSNAAASTSKLDNAMILVDGDIYAIVTGGTAEVRAAMGNVMFSVDFPGAGGDSLRLRSHAGITSVFDTSGRVAAVDQQGIVQANLRVRTV